MAYSSKAVSQLALDFVVDNNKDDSNWLTERAFLYGKNLGIGFQLMDDLLDFEANEDDLGKPAGVDLK